ncbi:hypothetical protein ETN89_20995 (plasmid) [Photobacterium damselae subsp. damselae]|uniref:hypothetical protein n=1 Tax=Photobacterium damselae TaxID=38293 RepID=UPI000A30064B|nr:hypothetical protein [Photobacterium damselae]ARR51739.1 hypothetical protein CAY62_20200 [Photobacterium damselae subsp. damselae]QAY37696.1 hypothetical protein ETN89_20995 [Photobacterium damselae subsp. damselae]
MKLNEIEQFLLRLEENEQFVFNYRQDDRILAILPFFQLVHVLNLNEIIRFLALLEQLMRGKLVRSNGYLMIALSDDVYDEEELRRLTIQLLEKMRF